MLGSLSALVRSVLYGERVTPDLRQDMLAYFKREKVAAPVTVAADLKRNMALVVIVCEDMAAFGTLRRARRQVVVPDEEGAIPAPFIRYELAP